MRPPVNSPKTLKRLWKRHRPRSADAAGEPPERDPPRKRSAPISHGAAEDHDRDGRAYTSGKQSRIQSGRRALSKPNVRPQTLSPGTRPRRHALGARNNPPSPKLKPRPSHQQLDADTKASARMTASRPPLGLSRNVQNRPRSQSTPVTTMINHLSQCPPVHYDADSDGLLEDAGQRQRGYYLYRVSSRICRVRAEQEITSPIVANLDRGTVVKVVQLEGRRIRMIHPCEGWCSLEKQDGTVLLQPCELPSATLIGKQEKEEIERLETPKSPRTRSTYQRYKKLLTKILKQHNPSKLRTIDKLLRKYRSSLPSLYKRVCEKYGVDAEIAPALGIPASPGGGGEPFTLSPDDHGPSRHRTDSHPQTPNGPPPIDLDGGMQPEVLVLNGGEEVEHNAESDSRSSNQLLDSSDNCLPGEHQSKLGPNKQQLYKVLGKILKEVLGKTEEKMRLIVQKWYPELEQHIGDKLYLRDQGDIASLMQDRGLLKSETMRILREFYEQIAAQEDDISSSAHSKLGWDAHLRAQAEDEVYSRKSLTEENLHLHTVYMEDKHERLTKELGNTVPKHDSMQEVFLKIQRIKSKMVRDRRRHRDWLLDKEQKQRLEDAWKNSKAQPLTKEAQKLVKLFQKYDPRRKGSITAKKLRQMLVESRDVNINEREADDVVRLAIDQCAISKVPTKKHRDLVMIDYVRFADYLAPAAKAGQVRSRPPQKKGKHSEVQQQQAEQPPPPEPRQRSGSGRPRKRRSATPLVWPVPAKGENEAREDSYNGRGYSDDIIKLASRSPTKRSESRRSNQLPKWRHDKVEERQPAECEPSLESGSQEPVEQAPFAVRNRKNSVPLVETPREQPSPPPSPPPSGPGAPKRLNGPTRPKTPDLTRHCSSAAQAGSEGNAIESEPSLILYQAKIRCKIRTYARVRFSRILHYRLQTKRERLRLQLF